MSSLMTCGGCAGEAIGKSSASDFREAKADEQIAPPFPVLARSTAVKVNVSSVSWRPLIRASPRSSDS